MACVSQMDTSLLSRKLIYLVSSHFQGGGGGRPLLARPLFLVLTKKIK